MTDPKRELPPLAEAPKTRSEIVSANNFMGRFHRFSYALKSMYSCGVPNGEPDAEFPSRVSALFAVQDMAESWQLQNPAFVAIWPVGEPALYSGFFLGDFDIWRDLIPEAAP